MGNCSAKTSLSVDYKLYIEKEYTSEAIYIYLYEKKRAAGTARKKPKPAAKVFPIHF